MADAVEAVSAKVQRPPVEPLGDSLQAGWLARAEPADPGDLPVLLDALIATRGKRSRARLNAIAHYDDPRLFRRLQAHLVESPYQGRTGDPYLRRAIGVLADSRSFEAHATLRTQVEENRGHSRPLGLWVARELHDAVRGLPELPAPTIDDDARKACIAITEIAARAAPTENQQTVDALFSAVYADPSERGIRAVLADVLVGAGDARGEFIAAQLQRGSEASPNKTERRLLRQWEQTWLGPVADFASKSGHEWRDGFPYRLKVGRRPVDDTLLDLDFWSTVVELNLRPYKWAPSAMPLLFAPKMKSLRAVWGLSVSQLFELRNGGRQVPWHTMGGFRGAVAGTIPPALARVDAPDLRRLALIEDPVQCTPQYVAALARAVPIERLDIYAPDAPWSTFYGFPERLRHVVQYSADHGKQWRAEFRGQADAIYLSWGGGPTRMDPPSVLYEWMRGQTRGPFTAVRLSTAKLRAGLDWRPVIRQTKLMGLSPEGFE